MDFIEMMESPYAEFEMTKPYCKEDSFTWFEWKGLKVRKYIGSVIVTDNAYIRGLNIGDVLPLYGMVTKSEWTTILKEENKNE